MAERPEFTTAETRARIGGLFDAPPSEPQRLETPDPNAKQPRRSLRKLLRSFAIAFAVIFLIGWALAVRGVVWIIDRTWRPNLPTNTMDRIAAMAPSLAYRLPADTAVTPDRAGVAYARLISEPARAPRDFTYRDVGERPSAPWRVIPLPAGLFPAGRGYVGAGLPPLDGVFAALRKGLNPTQRQALQLIGTAPVWREFDVLSRAGAVDIIGGQLVLPFKPTARATDIPASRLGDIRDLATAAVSRSAWHWSEGRRDSAEAVLRGVISVGALMTENSPFIIEQIVGTRVASTGRDALIELYALRGDPRGAALKVASEALTRTNYRHPVAFSRSGNAEEARAYLMSFIESRDVARGLRYEMLNQLPMAGCKSFLEVAFGAKDITPSAVAVLKRDAARFASDSAVLDLPRRSLNDPIPEEFIRFAPRGSTTILFVSRVFFNPRIANCLVGPMLYDWAAR